MLATIRDQGRCPCPRCLIQKPMISQLGTIEDQVIRDTYSREDNNQRISLVKTASNLIYRRGLGVKSKAVENVLQPFSMVPTMVTLEVITDSQMITYLSMARMLSQSDLLLLVSTYSKPLQLTCCTSSNLGFGRPFFFI